MLTSEELQSLYGQGPDAVFAVLNALQDSVLTLMDTVERQAVHIKELEDRLGKDSHNSSKPPSSDGFKKPKSLRPKSGRPSGGQRGHPGRTLEFADDPDHVIRHSPAICTGCGGSLSGVTPSATERRQVLDVPPIKLEVTEHQINSCSCPACGTLNRAAAPAGVDQPVQYGPGIHATLAYLLHFQLLPSKRTVGLMQDLFGVRISEGTLHTGTQRASATLAPVEEAIALALKKAPTIHLDETSQRICGKLNWLHVVSTINLTYYKSHPKRGKAALDAIGILADYLGRAVHDCWRAYAWFGCKHALCCAHLLRELIAIFEQQLQPWAEQMIALLLEIKKAVEIAKDQGKHQLPTLSECRFEARYRAIIVAGHKANPPPASHGKRGRTKQGTARNLVLRLDEQQASVLAFMHDFSVPFDNNLAERDLRMMKGKQKISGGFRSPAGAEAFSRIRGYISTLRKQGIDVLPALHSVFLGAPQMPDLSA